MYADSEDLLDWANDLADNEPSPDAKPKIIVLATKRLIIILTSIEIEVHELRRTKYKDDGQ